MKIIFNKKNQLLIVGTVAIILIMLIYIFVLNNNRINIIINSKVEPTTAEQLYYDLRKSLKQENIESKLYGYTYDNHKNLELVVKQAYLIDNELYDLHGNKIGDFSEKTLSETLENATTKKYYYEYNLGIYKEISVN